MAGNGKITETYKIVYNIYDDSKTGNNPDGSDAKLVDTYTQEVTVIVNAANLVLKADKDDAEEDYIWSAKIASDYKATLVPATPTEENKTTEENKKDDVPKNRRSNIEVFWYSS